MWPAVRGLHPRAAQPQSALVLVLTCPEHRLTPKERGRLRRGPDARRRAAFEKIKAEKLAADTKPRPSGGPARALAASQ